VLNIEINGTYLFDEFQISDFYILTDTFTQAGPEDTKGWITNPATKDTDNDGWTDYEEIFEENTNPLNPDTDGDGAWDSCDRDPLKNSKSLKNNLESHLFFFGSESIAHN
jgi:hypothetical protein